MSRKIILSLAAFAALSNVALAASKLPKDAVPLTSAEVAAIYKGKSSNWKKSKAYFAEDGSYLIVDKKQKWYGDGRWSVKGNKICAKLTWYTVDQKKTGKVTDCWTWFKSGRKHFSHWSGEKNPEDYYDGELKKL